MVVETVNTAVPCRFTSVFLATKAEEFRLFLPSSSRSAIEAHTHTHNAPSRLTSLLSAREKNTETDTHGHMRLRESE